MIEICCGSYYDALNAYKGGAKQIELNSALALGGLTPSLATLQLVKKETPLKVVAMVRPRAGGFCYSPTDFQVMMADAKHFLEHGADGIAFGFLTEDFQINLEQTRAMIALIHAYQKEAVFHRAIDVAQNYLEAIGILIDLGVDRILTSGQKAKVQLNNHLIGEALTKYGKQIELLWGSGINDTNAAKFAEVYGIEHIHSSCKDFAQDPTTLSDTVSYAFLPHPHETSYDVVSAEKVAHLIAAVEQLIER